MTIMTFNDILRAALDEANDGPLLEFHIDVTAAMILSGYRTKALSDLRACIAVACMRNLKASAFSSIARHLHKDNASVRHMVLVYFRRHKQRLDPLLAAIEARLTTVAPEPSQLSFEGAPLQ